MNEAALLNWRTKGLPPRAEGVAPEHLGQLGLNLLKSDLMMPVAVAREAALRNNVAEMQAFADRNGARLCPHGKTSMSPELFRLQLEEGAWGMTAATAHHVRVYRRWGIDRIFLANQLIARADVDFVLSELIANPDFDFYCLADTREGIDILAKAAAEAKCPRPVQILVETGLAGGRTGVRSLEAGFDLARHIKSLAPYLSLRGVETFEGVGSSHAEPRQEVREILGLAGQLAEAAAAEGLFTDGPLLLSAGGSGYLDLCAAELPARIAGLEVERILRPGCYITHDNGVYARLTTEGGTLRPGLPRLDHALEVWGIVQSVPEPGLAIVGVGRRDVSFDVELPIPLWVHSQAAERPRAAEGLRARRLWDQHLSVEDPAGMLAVGDMVGFGVSHPCGTFDKWTALLTVDEAYNVTGAVTTCF